MPKLQIVKGDSLQMTSEGLVPCAWTGGVPVGVGERVAFSDISNSEKCWVGEVESFQYREGGSPLLMVRVFPNSDYDPLMRILWLDCTFADGSPLFAGPPAR